MAKLSDFFEDEESFEEILEAAEENPNLSSKASLFIDELSIKYADYGMDAFISEGQVSWLKSLAQV